MNDLRIVTDLDEGRELWRRVIPQDVISDLWEVRACFHRHYQHPLCFIVAEDDQGTAGFLPLSRIEERRCLGYFPGEIWQGKTWLEQNRIVARDEAVMEALVARCHHHYHLRYLLPLGTASQWRQTVDEIGYLFLPPKYDFDLENYFQEFSHKSAKRIRREVAAFDDRGVTYRYDDPADFDRLVELNLSRFGASSYYADARFREGFRSLMLFLREKGWLRITAILIGGEPAAIDLGSIYRGTYTVLAGGASGNFPGVAKLINLHHMEFACRERLRQVDFLCGDFSWKSMFHLTPRPLYLMSNLVAHDYQPADAAMRSAPHA